MKLHEYLSKRLFAKCGIPIPQGEIARTPEEARQVAQQIGNHVVVKAQVLTGGRGKAGGIKVVSDADAAEMAAREILGMTIQEMPVTKVLIDQAVEYQSELYLGIALDRTLHRPVLIASFEGGVEIEEVARATPEKIFKIGIDPLFGLMDYQVRNLALNVGLKRPVVREFCSITQCLYQVFMQSDASLAEINPLVITEDDRLVALDGKIVLDDSALFRHKDLAELRDTRTESEAERMARLANISYVKLDGDIGCMVNGAGLAMATMDIINFYGGNPANFLDIGGGAKADRVATALQIILSDSNVKAVLFNIFGGITRCDEVAEGILNALDDVRSDIPMVARLVGTNQEEGRQILAEANMTTATSLAEAAQKAVSLA